MYTYIKFKLNYQLKIRTEIRHSLSMSNIRFLVNCLNIMNMILCTIDNKFIVSVG